MRNILLAILLIAVTSIAQANNTTEDTQIWLPVNINVTPWSNSGLRGFLELQPRFTNDVSTLGVAIIRPAIGYAITPKATIWVGYLMQATEVDDNGDYQIENRAWQGVSWKDTAFEKQFIWEVRNRLEERFLPNNNDPSIRWRTRFRGEYLLPITYPISVIASDEIFVNLNDNSNNRQLQAGLNQNRAYVGVGYRFNPAFQIETGYLNQYVPGYYNKNNQANNVWVTNININF